MIRADGVVVDYDGRIALDGVELHADQGEMVGLIGPNGSGKTTLLRTLYAALGPRAGLVTVDGTPVGALRTRDVARRLAVVVQEGNPQLPMTCGQVVLLGRSPHRSTLQGYTVEDRQIAADALTRVGARHLADRSFGTLSGGEKQRVLIARTLAQRADHLLLDEPTNHLDVRYQHEVLGLVRRLGVTTVVVLHDLNLAARYCDHLVLLDGGSLVRSGRPEDVLRPEVLEPVYGVKVRRVDDAGTPQLLFSPGSP